MPQPRVSLAQGLLQALPGGSDLVSGFRDCVKRIENATPCRQSPVLAPIHGAFGWDRIHYGVDGRFYLYRFETCRRSDPGLDLGGFAADLLRFTIANHNEEAYRNCLDTFLSKYNAEAEHAMTRDNLRFYIARDLVERLGRVECRTKADAGNLLAALDAESGRWEAVATCEAIS